MNDRKFQEKTLELKQLLKEEKLFIKRYGVIQRKISKLKDELGISYK